jgi:hypothetical protein
MTHGTRPFELNQSRRNWDSRNRGFLGCDGSTRIIRDNPYFRVNPRLLLLQSRLL